MTYPALSAGQDSKKFSITQEDPTVRDPLEGGYVFTRKRFTRTPRKTWTTGYSSIGNADKTLLENYWDVVTGAVIFSWTSPQNGVIYSVRFKVPMIYKYVGIGSSQLWDVDITLEQA